MLKMWDQPLFCNQKPREPDRISGSFSGALSQNTQSLKITKTFQKKANNICWEKSKPLGGGGLDGILNPSPPTQPPPYKRTQKDPSVQQSHQQGGNWWCLSDTFHFSHWNELSKLPS